MRFVGTVKRAAYAEGSKSEHLGVVLETQDGEFLLRREGGNPFADPFWDEWIGRRVSCEGILEGGTLFCSACEDAEAR